MRTMMKTLAVAALCTGLLSACGGDDEAAGTTTTAKSDIRVALVTDVGQLNDRGFNQLAYQGLKRAGREIGRAHV